MGQMERQPASTRADQTSIRSRTGVADRAKTIAVRAVRPFVGALLAARGYRAGTAWHNVSAGDGSSADSNPLRAYFRSVESGPGIWKWDHYFDVYHRHFAKFRGRDVVVLEIGVFSGGSLQMWQTYFGSKCHVYGVDIEARCKAYERESIDVVIGDQGDRAFWRRFKQQVPKVDIIIDDGSHRAHDQIVTLEEMLPHLSPGGVYLCEDLHGAFNRFHFYVDGLARNLHGSYGAFLANDMTDNERRISCDASAFQSNIDAVHLYPFIAVIETRETPTSEFVAAKRGTQWEPFAL